MHGDIIVYDGLDEMDAIGPLEVLRSASALGADVHAQTVTRVEQDRVRGAYGLTFVPDSIYTPGGADVLVVPSGTVAHPPTAAPGTTSSQPAPGSCRTGSSTTATSSRAAASPAGSTSPGGSSRGSAATRWLRESPRAWSPRGNLNRPGFDGGSVVWFQAASLPALTAA